MNFNRHKKYNFDINAGVNTYEGELALPYVTAALLGAETIAKNRCRFIEGIVGKTVISGLSSGDVIQTAGCAFDPGTTLALTEQVLDPSDLAVMEEVCRGTMYPTWIASNGRMERSGNLPTDWTDFLLGAVAERTGTQLESLLWASDTGAIFGTGFLSNDGLIDEAGINASATAGFAQHDVGTGAWTSTNILSHMSGVFNLAQSTPGILQKAGCGFYVSYEAYALFLQAMALQNTGPGFNQSMEGANYLGYPVYPTAGIPNASGAYEGAIVFTYPDNMVVGANSYTPDIAAELIPTYLYDGSDNVRISMRFACGVQTGVAGDGVVGFDFA